MFDHRRDTIHLELHAKLFQLVKNFHFEKIILRYDPKQQLM